MKTAPSKLHVDASIAAECYGPMYEKLQISREERVQRLHHGQLPAVSVTAHEERTLSNGTADMQTMKMAEDYQLAKNNVIVEQQNAQEVLKQLTSSI